MVCVQTVLVHSLGCMVGGEGIWTNYSVKVSLTFGAYLLNATVFSTTQS